MSWTCVSGCRNFHWYNIWHPQDHSKVKLVRMMNPKKNKYVICIYLYIPTIRYSLQMLANYRPNGTSRRDVSSNKFLAPGHAGWRASLCPPVNITKKGCTTMIETAQLRDIQQTKGCYLECLFFCRPDKLGVLDYLLFTPGEILVCGRLMWSCEGRGGEEMSKHGSKMKGDWSRPQVIMEGGLCSNRSICHALEVGNHRVENPPQITHH